MTYRIITIETPTLGDRSYLVSEGTNALVIDPQRDIDRVLAEATTAGVQIRAVFETHIHNDYVTGGLALARATGADYYVNADDDVAFDRVGIRDGDVVRVGDQLSVQAVLTPGHTFTHLSYLLRYEGDVVAAFTGGSLLIGAVGRTRSHRPRLHPGTRSRAISVGAPPHAGSTGRGAGAADPRFRQLLLLRLIGRGCIHHRPGEGAEFRAHLGRVGFCRGIAGRTRCVPQLLRAHGAAQY